MCTKRQCKQLKKCQDLIQKHKINSSRKDYRRKYVRCNSNRQRACMIIGIFNVYELSHFFRSQKFIIEFSGVSRRSMGCGLKTYLYRVPFQLLLLPVQLPTFKPRYEPYPVLLLLLLLLLRLTQLLLHDAFNNVAPVCSILCQFNQFI